MFSALLSPNFMPSLRKIVGAVFEICRLVRMHVRTNVRTNVHTNVRTDGAYFIDPRFSNRGPINVPILYIYCVLCLFFGVFFRHCEC